MENHNSQVPTTKKRSAAIDMVKGLSIMTLFYLHFEQGCFEYKYNYFLVRSPAFYMVVGWLWGMSSNKRTVKMHWEKRKNGLVMPYIYFSILFILLDIILIVFKLYAPFILWRDIYKTICLRGIGTLWFLPALLGGEMLFLSTRDKSKLLKVLIYIACFFLAANFDWGGNHFIDLNNTILNAHIRVLVDISYCFVFLSLTYYISEKWGKDILKRNKYTLFFFGAILMTISFYIANFISPQKTYPYSYLSFVIYNILSGFGILFIFTAIENFKLLSTPLTYCGRNSLIVMTMHYCFLLELFRLFDKHVLMNEICYGRRTIIYFAIALVLQVIIIEIINKKFRFLIGK